MKKKWIVFLPVVCFGLLCGCMEPPASSTAGPNAPVSLAESQPVPLAPPPGAEEESAAAIATVTVPEEIQLPNMGDTYQIQPVTEGIEAPIFGYISQVPEILQVAEDGLLTYLGPGGGIFYIYISATDGETGYTVNTHLQVLAGDAYTRETSVLPALDVRNSVAANGF